MKKLRLGILGLLVIAPIALSCGGAIKGEKFAFRYTEMRAKLDNGLGMVIIPDKNSTMVQVDIRYHVGSNQDPEGKAGLAHFLEHMMFQWAGEEFWGEGNDGPALFNVLPQISVGYNAYTNWDTTHYYLQGTPGDVAKLLDLEARRMRMARKAAESDCEESILSVPKSEFYRELEVVRNEIRWRSGDTDGQIMQTMMDLAYPEGHPYHQMIGGNDMQLASIKPKDVCEFFANYYMPKRATVLVAGNVDHEEVATLIKGYFGPIKNNENAKEIPPVPPIKLEYKKVVKELDVESPQVNVMWALPDMNSEDWPAANTMLNSLISRASYFVDEWKIARDIDIALLGGKRAPIFVFTAHLYKEDDVDKALDYIWLAAKGAGRGTKYVSMGTESKNRAKANVIASLESLATRTQTVAEMVQFSTKTSFDSKKDYLLEQFKEIDDLSDANFKSYIDKNMKKEKAVVLIVKRNPNVKGADKRAAEMFSGDPHADREFIDPREAMNALPIPDKESVLNKVVQYQLENGMKVMLLPTSSMPLVTAAIHFSAGSAHEPASQAGVAEIAASRLRNVQTSMALGKIGAFVSGDAQMDETVFYGRAMEIYLKELLQGMERTLVVGDYEQEGIEYWQDRYKVMSKLQSARAREAFSMAMHSAVYGPEHPWTLKGSATLKTYKEIGRDEAKDFADKHFVASNATLIIVGSFGVEEAKKHIKEYFGGFRKGDPVEPVTTPFQAEGAKVIGVVKKAAPQTTIQIQYRGPVGRDAEKYAARAILGNMLGLRMAKMRTILGSTYGARGYLTGGTGPRVYSMGGSFDSLRVGESLVAMRKEIADLRAGKGFNKDFVKARRTILKQLLAESTESFPLIGKLQTIAKYGVAPNYYDQFVRDIATMTPDKVLAVMTEDLTDDNEVIGIFADKETLEKAFAEAGLEAEIIEPE